MTTGLQETSPNSKLRILHVLRAPLGGLFRHVIDLTYEQIARGHAVGLVTDSATGGERAAETLGKLEPLLELGLLRVPMRRQPYLGDIATAMRIAHHTRGLDADVVMRGLRVVVGAAAAAHVASENSPRRSIVA